MADYEFKMTEYGVIGVLPSGEEREFASENDYYEAYTDEENEIIDALAELHFNDEPVDYPDHEWIYA